MAMNYRPHPALVEDLRQAAFFSRRSANDVLNEALRDWLDTKGKNAEATYRAEHGGEPVVETRSRDGSDWREEWLVDPPANGTKYRVTVEKWTTEPADGGSPIRVIYAYEPAE